MRPQRPISDSEQQVLKRLLKEAKHKGDYQRIQCVLLRAGLGLNASEVASLVGWSPGRIKQVWSLYFKAEAAALLGRGRGGRRRENLSLEQEKRLLQGFMDRARDEQILEASEIKRVYEDEVGHTVPKSTVYRMLQRHGWRKIAPRARHPKAKPAEQQAFKKSFKTS